MKKKSEHADKTIRHRSTFAILFYINRTKMRKDGTCQLLCKVEKAREFDPLGHAGLTPLGIIRLTPSGKIKMTPVDDTAGEFFCSFENPCPGTAGFNVKYYKI